MIGRVKEYEFIYDNILHALTRILCGCIRWISRFRKLHSKLEIVLSLSFFDSVSLRSEWQFWTSTLYKPSTHFYALITVIAMTSVENFWSLKTEWFEESLAETS